MLKSLESSVGHENVHLRRSRDGHIRLREIQTAKLFSLFKIVVNDFQISILYMETVIALMKLVIIMTILLMIIMIMIIND